MKKRSKVDSSIPHKTNCGSDLEQKVKTTVEFPADRSITLLVWCRATR